MKRVTLILILLGLILQINESNSSCEDCQSKFQQCFNKYCLLNERCLNLCHNCRAMVCPCRCAKCDSDSMERCITCLCDGKDISEC
ncbi:UNVERIFIED_CONTAM: hypothetical protein RMT77_017716 [Armadillidium vulgare]